MKQHVLPLVLCLAVAAFALPACDTHHGSGSNAPVTVALNLGSASVTVSQTQQFAAGVTGTTNTAVTWYVNDIAGGNATVGTITSGGLYTAPATVPNPATVTIKATSAADPTKSGTATVTIQPPVAVALDLASADVTVSSTQQFTATVTGTTNTTVTWYVNDIAGGNATVGTITSGGLYTAPATVPNPATVTIKATSAADPSKSGTSTVTIKAPAASTSIVSLTATGDAGNGDSATASISGDGRYVAFQSSATNLVTGDNNGTDDIFVRDRQAGVTTRVSVSSSGSEGNGISFDPAISADGRYVAFASYADDLVPGDGNAHTDVFVYDLQALQLTRVSVDDSGVEGNDYAYVPSISADGRYVAFYSGSVNLVSGDTNGLQDVFVRDRTTGKTTRVSVSSAGVQGDGASGSVPASISADGRYVVFASSATNLVANDTNNGGDVFVHDRDVSGSGVYDTPGNISTTRVNVDSAGNQTTGLITGFAISANGRYVVFSSDATNLIAADSNGPVPDVYVHDRQTGQTTVVSVSSAGIQAETSCLNPVISGDGRYVAFQSASTTLVPAHTDTNWDVFVRDRTAGQTTLVSANDAGIQGNGWSEWPAISSDGRFVAFESEATNLVPADINSTISDVFVRQLP